MIRNKKILIGVAVVAVGVLAVGGLSLTGSASSQTQSEEQVYLRTQTLSKETLQETVTGTGTVAARESAAVYSSVSSGKISEILVSTSDYVTEGDVMFTLDMTTLNENIAEKEEDIAERTADLQETFNDAKEVATEAFEEVYNSGGAQDVYLDAKADFDEVKNAISYLQTDYDTAYSLNQDATIKVNNIKSEIAALAIPTLPKEPVAPVEPAIEAEDYDALLEQYNKDKAEYDENYAQYLLDIDNYNNVLKPEYDAKLLDLNTQLSDAQAEQANTKLDLDAKTVALNDAKTSLNYSALEGIYTEAKKTYDTALSSYNSLLDKQIVADDAMYDDTSLATMQDQLQDYYDQREDYYIRAEISGQVTEINTEVGSVVSQNSALAKIQATDTLEIDISIPESDINKIKIGQSAVIRTDAFEEELGGTVVEISSTATQEGMGSTSSSFTVTIDVTNEISGLLVGMNAQADIIVASQESEFVVPLSAIETVGGVNSIYIQTGDELIEENFTKIEVQILENDGYYTQIKASELEEGMKVVTTLNAETTTTEVSEEMQAMMPGMGGITGGAEMPSGGGSTGGGMPSGGGGGQRG